MTAAEVSLGGYSPMDPTYQQDPFPYYAKMRDHGAVYKGPGDIYFIPHHASVFEVLEQPNLFSSQWGNTASVPPIPGAENDLQEILSNDYPAANTMLTLDPPLQTRYRKAVGKTFSRGRIAGLEPSIRNLARTLIEE